MELPDRRFTRFYVFDILSRVANSRVVYSRLKCTHWRITRRIIADTNIAVHDVVRAYAEIRGCVLNVSQQTSHYVEKSDRLLIR